MPLDHEELYVRCECHSFEHMFYFSVWRDGKWHTTDCYLEVQLSCAGPWYRRLWDRVRYLFGRKSKYGAWDEVCIGEEQARKIRDVMDKFLESRRADAEFHEKKA